MIARCLFNSGRDLGPPPPGVLRSEQNEYYLRPGAHYRIWGLEVFRGALDALIWDDSGLPNWLPVGLLEISAQAIPAGWEVGLYQDSGGADLLRVIWGYPRLVRDPDHSESLEERSPAALDSFFTYLAEDALSSGLWDRLRSRAKGDPLQLSEFLEDLGARLERPSSDPTLTRPAAKVIQLLVERDDLVVGSITTRDDGSLAVRPWSLGSIDIYQRIQHEGSELEKPEQNAGCWLEVTS